MKRWWLVIVLLLSLGVNLGLLASRLTQRGAPAIAGSPSPPTEDQPPGFLMRIAGELGLEGEERAVFVERQRRFFREMVAARERFAGLQEELRRQVIADQPDRRAVDELLEQIADAHVALERVFVDNLLDSREMLDPEQERRFMDFMHRLRHSRHDQRRLRDHLLREDGPRPWERRGFGPRERRWRPSPDNPG